MRVKLRESARSAGAAGPLDWHDAGLRGKENKGRLSASLGKTKGKKKKRDKPATCAISSACPGLAYNKRFYVHVHVCILERKRIRK